MLMRVYGSGRPSATRLAPHVVSGPPQMYSTKSPQSVAVFRSYANVSTAS
jgi:hypothetical protein